MYFAYYRVSVEFSLWGCFMCQEFLCLVDAAWRNCRSRHDVAELACFFRSPRLRAKLWKCAVDFTLRFLEILWCAIWMNVTFW